MGRGFAWVEGGGISSPCARANLGPFLVSPGALEGNPWKVGSKEPYSLREPCPLCLSHCWVGLQIPSCDSSRSDRRASLEREGKGSSEWLDPRLGNGEEGVQSH